MTDPHHPPLASRTRRPRPRIPGGILVLLVASLFLTCARYAPPSIVIILLDTLRADYLGCYGFDGPISPQVDAMAADAFRFRRCFAAAPWTKPSIASLFTSLYPLAHGVVNHDGRYAAQGSEEIRRGVLPEHVVTLAEALQAAGYTTGAFVANPWIRAEYGFDQGFAEYEAGRAFVPMRRLLKRATTWLDASGTPPFLLYIHLMEIHGPYRAPNAAVRALADVPGVRDDRRLSSQEFEAIPDYLKKNIGWTNQPGATQLQAWRTQYGAEMLQVDNHLGALFRRLAADGTLDNAWLVITSDHGEELFDHGGWDHGDTHFDELIHVPLILRPPGGIAGGRDIPDMVSLLDLMPTLVRLAGGTVPGEVRGRDLGKLLGGGHWERATVTATVFDNPGLASIRTPTHKLILDRTTGVARLYDLELDPGETRDRIADDPELARELKAQLAAELAAGGEGMFEPGDAITEEQREVLRSLGYTH